jgi:phosphoglycolate phosphatase
MPRLIALFDLDLTLLRVPIDAAIIAGALDAATGRRGLLDGFDYRGRSDRWLATAVAKAHGLDPDDLYRRYAEAYTPLLKRRLAAFPPSALPGAAALLAALRARPDTALGVATGNIRANALVKLRHAGLDGFFEPLTGGFGEDHEDRADIVRAAARACGHVEGGRLVVVGDTVHDVRAALEAGATAIGVATGHATPADLAAAGASAVLSGLDAPDALEVIAGTP